MNRFGRFFCENEQNKLAVSSPYVWERVQCVINGFLRPRYVSITLLSHVTVKLSFKSSRLPPQGQLCCSCGDAKGYAIWVRLSVGGAWYEFRWVCWRLWCMLRL